MTTQSVSQSGWAKFRQVLSDGANADCISIDLIEILDTVDVPIIVVRCDFTVECFNQAATEVLGLTPSDVGHSVRSIIGVEGSNLEGWCARVMDAEAPFRHEFRDQDRWFVVRVAPYLKSDRQLVGAVLTFTNVTAFRASVDQAIYERDFTKTIINTVVDPLVVLNDDLRVQTGNRAFYAMLGVSREEAQAIPIYQLCNGTFDHARLRTQLREMLLDDGYVFHPVELDREFQSARRTILLEARRFSLPGYSGRMILIAFQDITARKQSEAANARLAAIVDSSDDAIVSKNLDSIITSWNSGAERIFGYAAEEAIGKPITILIPPERLHEEPEILARIRRGERIQHFETVRKHKDGSLLEISVTISPITDASGIIIGASKIARDISERRKSEVVQRLLVEELKHRVKNTLATVQALASQTLKSASKEDREAFVGRVHMMANAYDVLTQDNWQRAAVRDLVQKALQPFQQGGFVADGPAVWVPAKKALMLTMAIHELATNALKYGALSNGSGRVVIDWQLADTVEPRLLLHWKEVGGPPVAPPPRKGFGSRLLEMSLDAARVEFLPDGVRCVLELTI